MSEALQAPVEVEGEPVAGADAKGAYYCPGCGIRYDRPGSCTGKAEAGHEPIAVEKVKGASTKADDADGGESKPKPKRKTSTSSKRKSSTAKRKTAGAGK
jgi:hypothetical protein